MAFSISGAACSAGTAASRQREAAHMRAMRSRTAPGSCSRGFLRTAQITRRGPVSTVSSNVGPSPAKYLLVQSFPSENGAPTNGEARIKVIGVGGGGGNALNRMIEADLQVRPGARVRADMCCSMALHPCNRRWRVHAVARAPPTAPARPV